MSQNKATKGEVRRWWLLCGWQVQRQLAGPTRLGARPWPILKLKQSFMPTPFSCPSSLPSWCQRLQFLLQAPALAFKDITLKMWAWLFHLFFYLCKLQLILCSVHIGGFWLDGELCDCHLPQSIEGFTFQIPSFSGDGSMGKNVYCRSSRLSLDSSSHVKK